MKILFITARTPYAGSAGGHVLVYQRIRRLAARGHQVGLLSFSSPGEAVNPADDLFKHLIEHESVPAPRPAGFIRKVIRLFYSNIPPYFWEFRSSDMMKLAGDMVCRSGYDVVIAEFSAMGQYLIRNPYMPAVRKIISCHFGIATSYRSIARTMGMSASGLRSRLNVNHAQRYEIDMYRNVDRVLVLTAHDRYALLNADPTLRINVIPVGVDADYFRPDYDAPPEKALIFTGQYNGYANLDAVQWFVSTCWPALRKKHPDLKFYVVGPGSQAELKSITRRDPSIVVTGEVEDVRPYLKRASVFVCPIRLGSGLRFKVYEAMASGVPVVTTTLGAEGIPLQNGDNCFMADQPEIMTGCIDMLLTDDALRQGIARQARALVVERFDWIHGMKLMERVIQDTFAH